MSLSPLNITALVSYQNMAMNSLAMTKLMSPQPGKVNTQVSTMSFTTPN